MSALPKIDGHGRITAPPEVQDAIGIHVGDSVAFRVVGPGKVELSTLQPMSLDAFIAKYGRGRPIDDWSAFRDEAEAMEACSQRLTAGNAILDSKLNNDKLVTRWRLWVPENWKRITPVD